MVVLFVVSSAVSRGSISSDMRGETSPPTSNGIEDLVGENEMLKQRNAELEQQLKQKEAPAETLKEVLAEALAATLLGPSKEYAEPANLLTNHIEPAGIMRELQNLKHEMAALKAQVNASNSKTSALTERVEACEAKLTVQGTGSQTEDTAVEAFATKADQHRRLSVMPSQPYADCTSGSESGFTFKPKFGSSAEWDVRTCDTGDLYLIETVTGRELLGEIQSQLDSTSASITSLQQSSLMRTSVSSTAPTSGSTEPISSGAVYTALESLRSSLQTNINLKQNIGSYLTASSSPIPEMKAAAQRSFVVNGVNRYILAQPPLQYHYAGDLAACALIGMLDRGITYFSFKPPNDCRTHKPGQDTDFRDGAGHTLYRFHGPWYTS